MPVSVSDLLAEPSLSLRLLAGGTGAHQRAISWVSTTELPDPLPFLRGGELVLTTGMLERGDEGWRDLAARLAARPVAALCFGTGLVHGSVPGALVAAAGREGLALLESPVSVPFVQISRWVADRIFAEQYAAVQAAAQIQDALVEQLLTGTGVAGVLRELQHRLEAGALALVEPDGRPIARHPRRPPRPATSDRRTADPAHRPLDLPIRVGAVTVARLQSERPTSQVALASFAVNILGLELARQQAVRTGRRELLGQVLEDILQRLQSEQEARRRLLSNGVRPDDNHRVVIVRLTTDADRLRQVLWILDHPFDSEADPHPTALVQGTTVVLLPAASDADEVSHRMLERLRPLDARAAIGISRPRTGVAGLRVGFHEAQQAARTGPGVHHAAPLSATGLLLGNLDLPLQEVAHGLLDPVLRHDERHGADLTRTLRSYLAHDGRSAATASDLVLHRNTLRYRLQLIERLTGRSLTRLTDRIELWFALAAIDWEGDDTEPAHRST